MLRKKPTARKFLDRLLMPAILSSIVWMNGCQGVSSGVSQNQVGTAAPGQLNVTPVNLSLGNVIVGTSGTASVTLTAVGADVTVTRASTSNSGFTVGGLSLPVTVTPGKNVAFTITFSPQVTGTTNATLTLSSNGQVGTTVEALTGNGVPASVHQVSLSWNASTSSSISGYNVYRAVYANPSCGAFSRINSTVSTTTLYTDFAVTDGTSYCYATTAVNSSSEESNYSNIVFDVQIPLP